jgi:hypothetical protein
MSSLLSAVGTPATTTITTTSETLAMNIAAFPVSLPAASPQQLIIRGSITITSGSAAADLVAKLRVGQNNTSTAQVGTSEEVPCTASTTASVPFHFIDTSGVTNLTASGYSLTITQVSATGNGTILQVTYEVDYSVP